MDTRPAFHTDVKARHKGPFVNVHDRYRAYVSDSSRKPTLPVHANHGSVGVVHTHRRDFSQTNVVRLHITSRWNADENRLEVGLQVLINLQLTRLQQTYVADVEGAKGE